MGTYTSTTSGIVLTGTPQNPVTIVAGAYVTNSTGTHSGDAVYGNTATAWSIANFGTIKATTTASAGIDLKAGGTITNAVAAQVAALANGILISGSAGKVSNSGTIKGTGTSGNGVKLSAGGLITNDASGATAGLISG